MARVEETISGHIRVGVRVRVLQPEYAAGKPGRVLSREALVEGQSSNRWLIQLDAEEVILSLEADEFVVLESG